MRRRRRPTRLLALVLLAAARLHAQPAPGPPPAKIDAVEAAISAEMSRREIPGLSAAVVLERELEWTNGYGLTDLENGVPAKAETV